MVTFTTGQQVLGRRFTHTERVEKVCVCNSSFFVAASFCSFPGRAIYKRGRNK